MTSTTEQRSGRLSALPRQPRVDSLDLPDDGRSKGLHPQSSTETSGIGSLGPDASSAHASTENVNLSPTGPPKKKIYSQDGSHLVGSQADNGKGVRSVANRSMYPKQANGERRHPMDQCGPIDDTISEHSDATNFDELFEGVSSRKLAVANTRGSRLAVGDDNSPTRMDEEYFEQSCGLLGRVGSRRGGRPNGRTPDQHDGRHSNRFLAAPTSAWLQWSEERRESYKRRKELMAQKQKEIEEQKVSTPVKKARKESLIFAQTDQKQLIDSDEDVHHLTVVREEGPDIQIQTTPRKKPVITNPKSDELNLTPAQWKVVYGFWQHSVFVRARHAGLIFAPLACIFGLISCFNDMWSNYEDGHHGLWTNCTTNPRFPNDSTPIPTLGPDGVYCGPVAMSKGIPDHDPDPRFFAEESLMRESRVYKPFRCAGLLVGLCALVFGSIGIESSNWMVVKDIPMGAWSRCYKNVTVFASTNGTSCSGMEGFQHWQLAVIALILFSLGFSLLASLLALCGLCALQLPRKVYFYHSAAEIYFVCALSSTTALVTYPLVMELQEDVPSAHAYSWGYIVGWGAPACFYISSLCMSVDDMIHSASKGRCAAFSLCGGKQQSRTPMNHV